MKLEDSYSYMEEGEEYTHFNPTRLCRSDDAGELANTGIYYPNYAILFDKKTNVLKGVALQQPRPRFQEMRDDSFFGKVTALKGKIEGINEAVGIIYALTEASDGIVMDWAVGTYSLYEVRGKRIGITALHTVGHGAIDPLKCKFFVDSSPDRWRDKTYGIGSSVYADVIADFTEVTIHMGALAKRTEYINTLNAGDTKYKENWDAEFGQSSEPVLDIMMFEAPAALLGYPFFHISPDKPVKGDLVLLIAYHSTVGGRKDTRNEYIYTTVKPLNPGDALYVHRSLGLGRVGAVGDGFINVINSTAHMSSGAGLLNEKLEVVAVNLGAFYDYPGDASKATTPPLAPWAKSHVGHPFWYDIKLAEDPAGVVGKKNRTVAVSVFHSGFLSMLSAIAP
jgi:hypothetical protein